MPTPVRTFCRSGWILLFVTFVTLSGLSRGQSSGQVANTGLFDSDRYEVSMNQEVTVDPDDATCGLGDAKSVRYRNSYITCMSIPLL